MLKIEMRHFQLRESYPSGTPYYWDGNTPNAIAKTATPPIGFVGTYFDVTQEILNVEALEFTWQVGTDDQHFKLTISDELYIAGNAASFVKDWLVNRAYSPQNIVEVRLTDLDCQKVIGEWLIKPQKFSFCLLNSDCTVRATMVNNDFLYDCIAKTKISDNWNGILNQEFRAYDYAVEKRPAVMTALLFCFGAFIGIIGIPILTISTILGVIFGIIGIVVPFPTFNDYVNWFYKLVGLGRVHSAAGVRDYTDNVCGKCGLTIDTPNNLFYQTSIIYEGSPITNPYYYLDVLYAQSVRGRTNGNANQRKLQDENIPIIALSDLYNDLGKVFNAKWYIHNDGLRFIPRQDFVNIAPIIDFSTFDQSRIIDICVDVTDKKQSLTVEYGYQDDTVDLLSRDARPRYSSKGSYDADGTPNPNYQGNVNKEVPFGAARFMDDGITKSYIDDATNDPIVFLGVFGVIVFLALQVISAIGLFNTVGTGLNNTLATIVIGLGVIILAAAALYVGGSVWLDASFNNVLVMSQDVCSLPKLLIWDGADEESARVINGGAGSTKIPNPLFNPTLQSYDAVHSENEVSPTTTLRNYPMFFDVKFKENVYDYFWSATDSRVNAVTSREVKAMFFACCDDINTLGLYQNGELALDKRMQYPQPLSPDALVVTDTARIEEIRCNFTTKKITLTGTNFN